MALNIGRRVGEDLFIGETRVELVKILSSHKFLIRVHEESGALEYEIDNTKERPIIFTKEQDPQHGKCHKPLAYAYACDTGKDDFAVIGIKAPRHVEILRGELYRQSGGGYTFSDRAREQIEDGLVDFSLETIAEVLPRTVVYSHPRANRRYEDLLFRMNGKIVEEVLTLSTSPTVVKSGITSPVSTVDKDLGFEINCK